MSARWDIFSTADFINRALVAEALELSTFMSGISDLDGELQRLDRGDWAG